LKKIVLILFVALMTCVAPFAHAAEEVVAPEAEKYEMASEDEGKDDFDYKLAFSLAGDFERGKQLASQAERFPRTCRFCHGADGVA